MFSHLAIVAAILLWSSAFIGIRIGLNDYSPGALALLRFLIAVLCLLPVYFKYSKHSWPNWKQAGLLTLIGPFGFAAYSILLNQSELQISAGIASFVVALTPVFSSILGFFILFEKPSKSLLLGLLVSSLGLLLIAYGHRADLEYKWAILLLVLAVVCGSIQSVSQKILLKDWSPLEVLTWSMALSVVFLSGYLPDLSSEIRQAPGASSLTCFYLGVIPTFVAQWCWSYGLSKLPLSHANEYLFAMPLITTGMGFMILKESPDLFEVMGGLVTLSGALIARSWRAS